MFIIKCDYMGTYGAVYVDGEDKDFYITGDAYPDEIIDALREILKNAKTSRDAVHALYDEISPMDSWIVEGVEDKVDYVYTIDMKNNLIITELNSYDPDEAKNEDYINEDLEMDKEEYGYLGEIKIEEQPNGGKKIMLYSKIR